jgi:hypothetical protein|tara:strand:- start:2912 stop:3160 length:249 start_codon:yes stop_codon:yes gene_type:complete
MNEVYKSTDEVKVQDHSNVGDINEYLGGMLGDEFKGYRKKWQKASRLEKLYEFPLFLVFEDICFNVILSVSFVFIPVRAIVQ